MFQLLLAQGLDPTEAVGELSKTDAGPWPAYIAVFLALCLVGLFGWATKALRDQSREHKDDVKARDDKHAADLKEIEVRLENMAKDFAKSLDERDQRQAQVWEKFTTALQNMRGP